MRHLSVLLLLAAVACGTRDNTSSTSPSHAGQDWRELAMQQMAEIKSLEGQLAALKASCAAPSPASSDSIANEQPAPARVAGPAAANPTHIVALSGRTVNDLGTTQRVAWSLQVSNTGREPVAATTTFELVDQQGFTLETWESSDMLPARGTVQGSNVRIATKNRGSSVTTIRVTVVTRYGAVSRSSLVLAAAEAPAATTAAAAPSYGGGGFYQSAGPRLALVSRDQILVDGTVTNLGEARTVTGTLRLLMDGVLVQDAVLTLDLPARGRAPYTHAFRGDDRLGAFTVELDLP